MDVLLATLADLFDTVPEAAFASVVIVFIVEVVKRLGFIKNNWHRVFAGLLNVLFWAGCYYAREKGVESQFLAVIEDVSSIIEVVQPILLTFIGSNLLYEYAKKRGYAVSRDYLDNQKAKIAAAIARPKGK